MRCDLKSSVAAGRRATGATLLVAVLISAAGALAGCGQKGPLSLPKAATAAAPASASAAPSAPAR